jgi:hypothetical protein
VSKSFELWIQFLGLASEKPDAKSQIGKIAKSPHFEAKKGLWSHPNHNWLRITRVIKSLRLLGLEAEAKSFFECLQMLHDEGFVSDTSFEFWKAAME